MPVSPKVNDIVSKVFDGHSLTRDEIVYLLSVSSGLPGTGSLIVATASPLAGGLLAARLKA